MPHILTWYLFYRNALKEFWGNFNQCYLFAIPAGESVVFTTETPTLDKIKKKVVMIVKSVQKKLEDFKDSDAPKEIIMMELNR